MTVALTGATGYIASHVAVALFERGHAVVGIDNFDNSSPAVLDRIAQIADTTMPFAELDVADTRGVADVLRDHAVDAVIHFAGLKAVGESTEDPLRYHRNNVGGSLSLLQAMADAEVTKLVFSSSATVYRPDQASPLDEGAATGPINPYGNTKLMVEQIIADVAGAGRLDAINLRYFNPVGAHPSGLIGEDPVGVPNNLMPFIMQVAVGRRPELEIFGDDYATPDGTCIRDYIHVCDLAEGHVAAVEALLPDRGVGVTGVETLNLGTGVGSSVLEMLAAAEHAVDHPIPHRVTGRRSGDSAVSFADPSRAAQVIGWEATRTITDACQDHWRWQRTNPDGYPE
ncbi:MAG: UDP-glucose 4-epimerase GalE [Actinomycetota bacterium]